MDKGLRQSILRSIIQEQQIATQEELLFALENKGVHVTQSTISRDMREIGVIKRHENRRMYYVLQESIDRENQLHRLGSMMKDNVTGMTMIQFVLVIRTKIEMANVLAAIFDEGWFKEIVGTLAGADTIVIFCKNEQDCQTLKEEIDRLIES